MGQAGRERHAHFQQKRFSELSEMNQTNHGVISDIAAR